jgi:hypothetical protein
LLRQWRNQPGAVARAADEDSATALTQISYGGRVIVDGLLVHGGLDALVALVPYAGGALNDEAFKARSWAPRRVGAPPVQTIVICRPPRLTQLEQRVLASLPDDVEGSHRSAADRRVAGGRGCGTDAARRPGRRARSDR